MTASTASGQRENGGRAQPASAGPATDTSLSFLRGCRQRPLWGLLALVLLIVHLLAASSTASYCTVTHDEYWHVPVGLLNVRHARFDLDNLNPPLGRMLAGLPLMFSATTPPPPESPYEDIWRYGDEFEAANHSRYHQWIFLARLPVVLCSALFAVLAAHWSARLFGFAGGMATFALWTLSPSIVSMAALATNDLLVSGLFLTTLFVAWSATQNGRWTAPFTLGLCVGLACLVKFTGLLLFALAPATLLICGRLLRPQRAFSWLCRAVVISCVTAVLVINAGYLFQGSLLPVGDYAFASRSCQTIQSFSPTPQFPVPLPRDFLLGVDHQRSMMESDHPVYLDGEWSRQGFRSYFLWVLAWKLPHAVQLAVLTALLLACSRHGRPHRRTLALTLGLPAMVLLVIGSLSSMQLGLRYILPALPCLYVLCGLTFDPASRSLRVLRYVTLAGLCLSVLALRHHPQHIGYFNELSGGPEQGWRRLSDSNVDWGQDLRAFAAYAADHPEIQDLKFAYFGTFPPGRLGLTYRLPPSEPEPGWYAISVNLMQGRPNPVRLADDQVQNVFDDPFLYLRSFEPVKRIGAIHVFHVTEQDIIQRRIDLQTLRFGVP